ncbi:DoxX family protein [Jatrophihabitans sp. YIM 134969]
MTTSTTSPAADRSAPTARLAAYGVTVFRVVIGGMFLTHGTANLFGWPAGGTAPDVFAWPGWYASVIELVVGALVVLGLFTRPAALLGSGAMAYAYFSVHLADGFWPVTNGAQDAALYAWGFLLLACTGPGALSLGRALAAGRRDAAPAGPPIDVRERETARV